MHVRSKHQPGSAPKNREAVSREPRVLYTSPSVECLPPRNQKQKLHSTCASQC